MSPFSIGFKATLGVLVALTLWAALPVVLVGIGLYLSGALAI